MTLYTVWRQPITILYDGNGSTSGTMNYYHTNAVEGETLDLFAPNFTRTGCGFAGWSLSSTASPYDGSSVIYGPNEAFVVPPRNGNDTMTLYAVWIAKDTTYTLQTFNDYAFETANPGKAIVALEDERDNKVYTVARLADNRWWMIENLKLESADSSDGTLAQGFSAGFVGLASSEGQSNTSSNNTSNSKYNTTLITGSNTGYRFPRYYTNGTSINSTTSITDNRLNATGAHGTAISTNYSYGNWYNFAAATASILETPNGTSICPKGWYLPSENSSGTGEFNKFDKALGGTGLTQNTEISSQRWREYPNNYVYSGYYGNVSPSNSAGDSGTYWSRDTSGGPSAYYITINPTNINIVSPHSRNFRHSVRCISNETKTISKLTYLQDFRLLSNDDKATVLASMTVGTNYSLIDNRDNQTYTIAKMEDGKIWMTENLNLGSTTLTTNLAAANTNISTIVNTSTFNGWKKTSGTGTYVAGELISISGTDATSGTAYGTLYNYYAASAGTISGSANSNNATYDICPAGWRLPTGGSSGEFQALYDNYNSAALLRAPIANGGAAFALSGSFYDSIPSDYGDAGHYWSSTMSDSASMNSLNLNTSVVNATGSNNRQYGRAIRCVAK